MSAPSHPKPLIGETRLPGDKSISHRAVMAALLVPGTFTCHNLATNADVTATMGCLIALGGRVEPDNHGSVTVSWPNPWQIPTQPLDCKNSGTTLRLLAGVLAGKQVNSSLIGDHSLQRRPMGRILTPLGHMGATIESTANTNWQGQPCQTAPLTITPSPLQGITYALPMASAQVKSAILLAGLHAKGETTVVEPTPSRDHTERLLTYLGLPLETTPEGSGYRHTVQPIDSNQLTPRTETWTIPGDMSSAAFLIVAVLLTPGSQLTLQQVGINPTRTGLLDVLAQWGIQVELSNETTCQGEPVADLTITHQPMIGDVTIAGDLVPRLIDELPILAIAALGAKGRLVVKDAEELRRKESDRIALLATTLAQLGYPLTVTDDGFIVDGHGLDAMTAAIAPTASAPLPTAHDHRIAMALRVLNHACQPHIVWPLDHPECMAVSFPGFDALLHQLSAPATSVLS